MLQLLIPVSLSSPISACKNIYKPLLIKIFKEGREKYGPEAWSTMIVKRLEDACNIDFRATGFPAELKDDEPEEIGYEIK